MKPRLEPIDITGPANVVCACCIGIIAFLLWAVLR